MKITRRMATIVALAIAAFASTARAQKNDAAAIRALSDQWQQEIGRQNVDWITALHAPDAVVMMSNTPRANGSVAIRGMYSEMVKTPGLALHWIPQKIEVASPRVATEYGTYTMSYDTPQGKMNDAGNYVTIWHKVNGKWRVALDAPITSAPMQMLPIESSAMEMHSGTDLTWSDVAVPGFPPGAKMAVLHGNPGGPGGFALRLSFPDGYQIPVHWHPTAENVTVVSGNLSLGMGNTFDASALHAYGVGDYAYLPPRSPHYGQAHGATVVQINGRGPFVINPGVPK